MTSSPIVCVDLVALAGDDHDVAWLGQRDRQLDRRRPIDLDLDSRAVVVGDAGDDVVDDVGGMLRARVVGGDNDEVGEPYRRRPHLRPLRTVAITAGAEHDDDPATITDESPGGGDHLLEAVGRVGEVDDDVDRQLRAVAGRHPFEPTGDGTDRIEPVDDRLHADADRLRRRRRADGVDHVERATERDGDALAAPGEGDRRSGDLDGGCVVDG